MGVAQVSIPSTRVHKQWARDLDGMLWLCRVVLEDGCRDQRVHPLIEAQHALHLGPVGKVAFLTCTITSSTAQGGSHRQPLLAPLKHAGRKLEEDGVLPLLPASCRVRKTEARGGRSGWQIEGETIALAFLSHRLRRM